MIESMAWCFQDQWPHRYFPFPGAEKFVPAPREGEGRRIFAWGPTHRARQTHFLGDGAGPLRGSVKKIYHTSQDDIFDRTVFSLSVGGDSLFVYAVRSDGSHFVDKIGTFDIYLARRLIDIERAFPNLGRLNR